VPHLDPAIRIEAVTPNAVATYEAVEREIFGVAPAEARDRVPALERGIASGSLRAYLVRLGGEPVATARLATAPGLAALHGVGVVERFRGQGYGRLITTIVTRAGLALSGPGGLVWLSVAPHNGAARALYDSLDYRPAFDWELFISAAAV
jgi:ribosomal protein S18 acetylase RimI-like enzyme